MKNVIAIVKELVENVGEEESIKLFEKRIEELGEPKTFEDLYKVIAWETAISYIKGEIDEIIS